ncbi:cysteine desulfurase [Desulfurococcaceae archaeon MEX13E-LK6-19]|nr:cysteine desulfurase [Desulfurococcaceae archaeon MEX13E-LK6-19]
MLNPYAIRRDFPVLSRKIDGKTLIYFDNAATSQKPIQVINAITEFYKKYNANIHRGLHTLSQEASEMYEEAHDVIAKFINARGRHEIIFVKNTTEALNLVAYAWGLKNLKEGDEIIVTIMEHHSNFIPWFKIASLKKACVKVIDVDRYGRLKYSELEEAISKRTKIVALSCMSNVTGVINDVKRVTKIAHEVGAIVVADGAQRVPHMPTDVRELGVDFLAFSGHKMLGPTGTGVLYVNEDIQEKLDTFMVGGDTIKEVHYNGELKIVWHDLPWRFEAGTPNIAGAIGLAEAAKYLMKIGMENIHAHEVELVKYFFKRITEEDLVDKINIIGPHEPMEKGGIIAFTIKDLDPHATAMLFDEEGIAVRSGFHCAQPLHERLGFTRGSVRASFYLYNTFEEIDKFIEVIKSIINGL